MVLVLGVTLVLTAASYAGLDVILRFLQVPSSLRAACGAIFAGLLATAASIFVCAGAGEKQYKNRSVCF